MFREPPLEWIQSLRGSTTPVYPISEANIAANPEGMSDHSGSHSVGAFVVHSISWQSESEVVIEAEFCGRAYVGGGLRFRLTREGGNWRVTKMEITYVT